MSLWAPHFFASLPTHLSITLLTKNLHSVPPLVGLYCCYLTSLLILTSIHSRCKSLSSLRLFSPALRSLSQLSPLTRPLPSLIVRSMLTVQSPKELAVLLERTKRGVNARTRAKQVFALSLIRLGVSVLLLCKTWWLYRC
jgi:hypothetical protein